MLLTETKVLRVSHNPLSHLGIYFIGQLGFGTQQSSAKGSELLFLTVFLLPWQWAISVSFLTVFSPEFLVALRDASQHVP